MYIFDFVSSIVWHAVGEIREGRQQEGRKVLSLMSLSPPHLLCFCYLLLSVTSRIPLSVLHVYSLLLFVSALFGGFPTLITSPTCCDTPHLAAFCSPVTDQKSLQKTLLKLPKFFDISLQQSARCGVWGSVFPSSNSHPHVFHTTHGTAHTGHLSTCSSYTNDSSCHVKLWWQWWIMLLYIDFLYIYIMCKNNDSNFYFSLVSFC